MKQKSRKPESFIRQPDYPGGKKALDEFIRTNLKYPEEAIRNNIQGSVAVDFDIDIFGDVSNARIKHGIGYGCDEEAIRLVSLLKFQKKRYKGMHVVFHKSLNIHFHLHTASKIPPQQQTLTYSYTEKQDGKKISYNIKLG